MIRLENWSVIVRAKDSYQAPELWSTTLYGNAYGHPKFNDGDIVSTSSIMEVNGRIIKTYNSVYELGKVSEDYVKWCEEHKVSNREKLEGPNPIKIKE